MKIKVIRVHVSDLSVRWGCCLLHGVAVKQADVGRHIVGNQSH